MTLDLAPSLTGFDRIPTRTMMPTSNRTVDDEEETIPDRGVGIDSHPRNTQPEYVPEWDWRIHYHLQCQTTIAGVLGFRGLFYRATQWEWTGRDSRGAACPSPRRSPDLYGEPSTVVFVDSESSSAARSTAAHSVIPSSGAHFLSPSTTQLTTAAESRGREDEAIVTFQEVALTGPGETILVVGSISQLGSWNVENAVPLSDKTIPVWSGSVHIPPGTSFEYKFIKRSSDGSFVWEEASNHSATITTTGVHIFQTSWR
ncbi:carbohydrate-binding-like protein [Daedaleopsis nitida]|nr:carbohydrate-binding-like protein [Daedaleopsis nitida]